MNKNLRIHVGKEETKICQEILQPIWNRNPASKCTHVEAFGPNPWDISKNDIYDDDFKRALEATRRILGNPSFNITPSMMGGPVDALAILFRLYQGASIGAYDLGHGLHFSCLDRFIKEILKALATPNSFLTAITYRPLLLKHVRPEEIFVHAVNSRGQRWTAKLESIYTMPSCKEHFKENGKWSNVNATMDSGEIWIEIGEDWCIQVPDQLTEDAN